jgi:hypothetical protein
MAIESPDLMAFGGLLSNNSHPISFSALRGPDLNHVAFCTKTVSQNISHMPTKSERCLQVKDTNLLYCLAP